MALEPGRRLGPYEILGPTGAGGMGEVYRAKDTRLERSVAIKVLPAHLSSNPDLRARFEREARAISSLNHPHICTLHDVGRQDETDYIVMELVEGETLAERLKKGPLPTDQLLSYGIQIADALSSAHRHGIVHRDLKPGNIMLTKSGTKLLDFGLAKLRPEGTAEQAQLSTLPTAEQPLTDAGAVLGTFQYMAPEQVEGREADARTDIFAFGALLYEMATARKAFDGRSRASVIAAILEREPPPISTIQPLTLPALDRVVRTCLAKDPDQRWQNAHDLIPQLKWIAEGSSLEGVSSSARPLASRRAVPLLLAGFVGGCLVAGFLAWTVTRPGPSPAHFPKRLTLDLNLPSTMSQSAWVVISPDGTQLVFSAAASGSRGQLYVRPMDQLKAMPLPGTEGANLPFFSPDGQWLGFFAEGKLKKTQIGAKEPLTLCDARAGRGASWGMDGTILFTPHETSGLFSVLATGGAAQKVTTPEASELGHYYPEFLPGGKTALFRIVPKSLRDEDSSVALLSLETGRWRVLVPGGVQPPHYAGGFLLLRSPQGSMRAARFDPARGELKGPFVPVLEDLGLGGTTVGGFAVSGSGVLAYTAQPKRRPVGTLVWVDRRGREEALPQSERSYGDSYMGPALSPDGHRIAVDVGDPDTGRQVWLADQTRGKPTTWTRLTFEGDSRCPFWSPDGERVAFVRDLGISQDNLLWLPADGSGKAEPLTQEEWRGNCPTFSPDGKLLVFDQSQPSSDVRNIAILPVGGKPEPILAGPSSAVLPRFAPNGRWLAYMSNESGRLEVYVRRYPGPGRKWQVSTNGGGYPRWARNGRELFYREGDKLIAVTVRTEPDFTVGVAQILFEGSYARGYDVSPDGQRFMMIKNEKTAHVPNQLVVVPDWFQELEARLRQAAK